VESLAVTLQAEQPKFNSTDQEDSVRRNSVLTSLAVVFFVTLLLSAASAAALLTGYVARPGPNPEGQAVVCADDGEACTLADAAGRWGYSYSGTIVGFGPVASVGSFVQDAAGNVTGTQTRSFVGNIAQERIKGVVIVHADCTTVATSSVYQNGVFQRIAELEGVLVDRGRALRAIFKTAGTVITTEGRRISARED
jgi:hypothetical protein